VIIIYNQNSHSTAGYISSCAFTQHPYVASLLIIILLIKLTPPVSRGIKEQNQTLKRDEQKTT